MELDKYIQIFLSQADEYLGSIRSMAQSLEEEAAHADLHAELMSAVHSLKGMARTVGFSEIEKLAHCLEDLIKKIAPGKKLRAEEVRLLFEGLDALDRMIEEAANGAFPGPPCPSLIEALSGVSSQETPVLPPAPAPKLPPKPPFARVKAETLDRLLNLVSESMLCQGRLEAVSRGFPSRDLRACVHQMNELLRQLHFRIVEARLMPVRLLTDRMATVVRSLGRERGKDVSLRVTGEEVEMDRAIIEGLEEPLLHIMRNAVDHGIETPEERERAGKPARGTIALTIERQKESVAIKVEDDGKGIDPSAVVNKALAMGMFSRGEAQGLSSEDAMMLICTPGFSTAERITEVSGRGHGMHIVKSKVEGLGGSLTLGSRPGAGTRMLLRLPLTVSILPALVVGVGTHYLAFPVAKVVGTAKVLSREVVRTGEREEVAFRNASIPLRRVREVLGLSGPQEEDGFFCVVIAEVRERSVGLVVDRFVGQQEVVIRPLKPPLTQLRVFSGITLLGNGEIAFVVNLEELGTR